MENWGIWKTFNTAGDTLAFVFVILLALVILYLLYSGFRPRCYVCQTRLWRWEAEFDIFGSGPETCEVAYRHKKCGD